MYYDGTINEDEPINRLDNLIREFNRLILEGKPFEEVKQIYLQIKEIKMLNDGAASSSINIE